MSMGDLPPRLKMISMMYLVLLALLAMNVSKEILNSFVIINEGLQKTNDSFKSKNAFLYSQFDKQKLNDPLKVGPYWKAAQEVKELSESLDEHIKELKARLIAEVEQIPVEVADTISLMSVDAKDNHDVPTHILIGSDAKKPNDGDWSALELKSLIFEFNRSIKDKLPPDLVDEVDVDITLDDVKEGDMTVPWEIGNFYHMPLASVITNLSRLQAEVKNVEADVIKSLYSKISADDFSFDTLAVKVIPLRGSYINVGDSFKAEVIVAAYSTTQDPRLLIGDYDPETKRINNPDSTVGVKIKDGIATYSVVPRTPGEVEWGGVIKIKKPNGEEAPYPFTSTFMAAKPNLVVSPTKMNVFYRGLANPIDVSVPGVPAERLSVSVSNAEVRKTGSGQFEVAPGKDRECKVTVVAEMNGKKTTFPPMEFRVKPVPDPIPSYLGQKGSFKMTKGEAASGKFITASLDDFLFDLKYKVNSFEMTVTVGGKSQTLKSGNNQLTSQMTSIFKSIPPGQKIIIDNIVAERVPGGKPSPIPGNLIIEIK